MSNKNVFYNQTYFYSFFNQDNEKKETEKSKLIPPSNSTGKLKDNIIYVFNSTNKIDKESKKN